ncbi:hypothetical protein [Mucilaginibacter lappiensis]|uniref:DUF3887 domain-containing protein n=1 Tax=Mucilaginibacter lappiensis TaxID=354630 RepID=A0A841JGH4_9SPHI|nr:hypothetical protein [Mucilaginibacter lappiensis]MBB6129402.1 hypothetical protein [Mucilaginibacter lappiensis]
MKNLILLIILVSVTSCTFNNVAINQEADNKDGKAFLNEFYGKINTRDFEGAEVMIGDSLKKMAGDHGISKMLQFINTKVGNYKSYKIADLYIRSITGNVNETSYNYKLKVKYQKGTIDEIIGFKRQNGKSIKINSYHAYSDLLIH